MAQMIKTRMVSVPRLESLITTIGGLRGPVVVFSTQPEAKRHPIQFAIRLNRRSLWVAFEAIATIRGARSAETGHGSISFRWVFGALLCEPGLRRQTILQSRRERSMQDREHSTLLQQDDDPERQKGVRHPISRSGQHGHHLQTRGGLVNAAQALCTTGAPRGIFHWKHRVRSDASGSVGESLPLKKGEGRMGTIVMIMAVPFLSATGIYNPPVMHHGHCIAEAGTFAALYCPAPTAPPRRAHAAHAKN
jgi:hypothetical protein